MVSKGKQVAGKDSSTKRKHDYDSDKTGRRKRKNPGVLQFFEDAADEFDENESSDDDLDDFLEDESDTEVKVKKEPGKVHNVPFLPKEEEMSEEELEKYLEERYRPGSSFVTYAEDGYESKRSVERNAFIPSAKDPTVWKVKCMVGRERHSVFCLMQKFVDLQSLGSKLQIVSAFSLEHVKGFIYIEADKQWDVNEACKGLCSVYSTRVSPVPKNEVSHLLSVRSKYNEVSAGTWARVKNGKYKGDLAQVMAVNHARKKATVKLIPRVDLQLMAEKFAGGVTPKKTVTPAPRLISSSELEEFRPLIQYRRDRDTGEMLEALDGLMFKDGFIYKKVSIDSLSFWAVTPSEDELLKFMSSTKEESGDLEWLSQLYGDQKKKPTLTPTTKGDKGGGKGEKGECSSSSGTGSSFEVHDLVFFGRKNCGVIIGTEKDDSFKILKEGSEGPLVVTVEQRELKNMSFDKKLAALDQRKKTVFINDTVKVLEGPLEGRQGIVKQIYRGTIFLYDENELENSGYFCLKSHMCEKIKRSDDKCSGKGGESEPLGFEDFPSSPKSPLSPKKPWEARENNSNFNREDKDGMFSVGQALRIKVGPLKGYICRVLAVRRSDVTVKLDSQQKVLTVKCEHLSEVRAKSSAIPMGDDPESVKPFDLLGTQDCSRDWMDGAATSADGGRWTGGGLSTERSSWPSFPASSFSLQPESNSANPLDSVDNDGKKDVGDASWESQVAPSQGSSWGTAVADEKAVVDTQVGGWKKAEGSWKKDTADIGIVGGASDSWGRPKVSSGDQAGPSKDAGDIWGKAKLNSGTPDNSSNDATTAWGKNNWAGNNQKDGWQKPEEKTLEKENNVTGNTMSSWNNASTGKNQLDAWGKGKDGGSSGSTWCKAVGSQDKGTGDGVQEDSWGKAAPKWGSKDGSGGSKAVWNSSTSAPENQDQKESWNKPKAFGADGGSSWTKQDGGFSSNKQDSWNKQEGGSWNKQGGGSSWNSETGGSSWGKQNDVNADENSMGRTFDGGRSSGGRRGRGGGRGGGGQFGRGRMFGEGESSAWGNKGQENNETSYGTAAENQPSWNSGQVGWSKAKAFDGGSGGSSNVSKPIDGSWNTGNNVKEDQGTDWKNRTGSGEDSWNASKPSSEPAEHGGGWNKRKAPEGDGWNNFKPSDGGSAAGWGQSSKWNSKGNDAGGDQDRGWGNKGNWNSGNAFGGSGTSSDAGGNQDSWGSKSNWNSENASGGSENQTDTFDNRGRGGNWRGGGRGGRFGGRGGSDRGGFAGRGGFTGRGGFASKANDAGGDQDCGWGNKSNWNSGNAFGGSGTSSDAGGNQDSWGNKSKWNSENASGGSENQTDTYDNRGRGGNWRGGRGGRFGGRGGSDTGGFADRGSSERGGGFGGRGGSYRGGFRGRDGGDFGGRGRGRRGQSSDWNNRNGSGEDKSYGWNEGSNNNSEGWKSSGGSWNQGGVDKNNNAQSWKSNDGGGGLNQGGGNKGQWQSWSKGTGSKDAGGSDDFNKGLNGSGGGWKSKDDGGSWNQGGGASGSWNQSNAADGGQSSGSGWNQSKDAKGTTEGGGATNTWSKASGSSWGNKESGSGNGGAAGSWNQSNAADGGQSSGSGWNQSKDAKVATEGGGATNSWSKVAGSSWGNKESGPGNGGAAGSWNQSKAADGGQSAGSGWNQSKDAKGATEGGGATDSWSKEAGSSWGNKGNGGSGSKGGW
ncbi:protein RNA-directed DNA methylation 3 [Cornus florida]|uniref:protein RNA-directed DNA methylation 3 n=1 Tax=Cornus florida TaxID=4283 RepID=UPI00289E399A|nr:protein RNA-directed DNA methylation 3 [Cornus florida]